MADNNEPPNPVAQLSKPLVVFDGACGFCRKWIRRWQSMTGDAVYYVPYQGLRFPYRGFESEDFERAVHLFLPDGRVVSGANAVFQILKCSGAKRWPGWLYDNVPLVAPVTECGYSIIAKNRGLAGLVTRWGWGSTVVPQGTVLTRWVFIRLLAMVYFIAFVSLGVQILGLIGSNGILPVERYLDLIRKNHGDQAMWQYPTLAWMNHSDAFLQGLCWAGAGVSILAFFRIAPAPLLLVAWVLYLSLYKVGQTFLSFQWDLLLLEAGLLGVFFAPWKLLPSLKNEPPPSRVALWLVRWLVFRLMFCSGVVKLLDENPADPTWYNLTALTFHYETQCIPNAIAWFAHQLPLWFQKLSVVGMFVIEILVPFLIFLPRRPRMWSCVGLIFLQMLIILTGNYNFFNLLSIALCVTLLDDGYIRRLIPNWISKRREEWSEPPRLGFLARWSTRVAGLVIFGVSCIWMVETFVGFQELPAKAQQALRYSMRFGSVNNYGLFRSMTTRRPEIIIEGSNDRREWLAYEFKWKPGELTRRPPFVAPHQPRLDWQMWFAALGDIRSRRNQWFVSFVQKLLEGEEQVLMLLDRNPFPDAPPRFIRARLFDYKFTDPETRQKENTWWRREFIRQYCPVVSLNSFRRR